MTTPTLIKHPLVFDARGNGEGGTSPTITGGHEASMSDYTAIVVEPMPFEWHNQDSRVTGPIDTACTLNTNVGGGERGI